MTPDPLTLQDAWNWMKKFNVDMKYVSALQVDSLKNVIGRQGAPNGIYYDTIMDCLMVGFDHILIGIEKDGYAHS